MTDPIGVSGRLEDHVGVALQELHHEAVADNVSDDEWHSAWNRTMTINLQAAADLLDDGHRFLWREFPSLHQDAFQVAAVDVIHGDEFASTGHA